MQANVGDITESEERAEHAYRFLHFATSFYVIPLFMFFSVADYIWYPDKFKTFFLVRLITSLSVLAITRLAMRRFHRKYIEWLATLFVMGCLWPIHFMIFTIGEPSTPYYAGLLLVTIGLSSGLRMSWPFFAFCMAQAVIPYLAFGLWRAHVGTTDFFWLNLTFMTSINIIMAVSRWFTERLHRTARELRARLSEELIGRDHIIARKTAEALELHHLSKQFSPQIISSLSGGNLHLVDKVHRSEICTVFVDIVGSTNKFISIDRDDLQKILSMYMEDVMGIFLKYDITIDKFLGDGVLAFSNDPVPYPDYIERVLRAALEIKSRIRARRDEYMRYWLAEFEISFGIATGHASVGFYGSDLHVKSYTAIGRVVNLAARLGSMAGPNEILISNDVVDKLRDLNSSLLANLTLTPKGAPALKGFESEKIPVFAIEARDSDMKLIPLSDIESCPHGHGLLFLAQDQNGIYFFKCRFCDYVQSDDSETKQAA